MSTDVLKVSPRGSQLQLVVTEIEVTLALDSVNTITPSNMLPEGTVQLQSVTARVTEAIGTATEITIVDTPSNTTVCTLSSVALDDTAVGPTQTAESFGEPSATLGPSTFTLQADEIATSGKVVITAFALVATAPTS